MARTINTKPYDYVGTLHIKSEMRNQVGGAPMDGVEEWMWAKMFPMYVVPQQYSLKVKLMATANETDLTSKAYYRMSGRVGNVPQEFQWTPAPNNQDPDALAELYVPIEGGSVGDNSADDQVNVGIVGGHPVSPLVHEFFTREKELGLPKQAFMSADGACRFVDTFSTQGKIRGEMLMEDPKYLHFGVTLQAPLNISTGLGNNTADVVGAGEITMEAWYEALIDLFDSREGNDVLVRGEDMSVFSGGLDRWTSEGVADSASTAITDLTMNVSTYCHVQCSVYKPKGGRVYSAP